MKNNQTLSLLSTLLFTLLLFTPKTNAQWNDPGATVLLGGNTAGYNNTLLEVDGKPAIAYCDPLNNYKVKYRSATDSKGTTWGSSVTIDAGNFTGYFDVDMEIINGNPAVVSSSAFDHDIRYTRASDAAGVFWNSTVVVAASVTTNNTTQRYFDLEEVNGKPAIAYYDSDDGDLYYVQATDANGNFWGTPVLIASTGNVGKYLSLAMINGRPAISYYDATNQDLMYVRANNADGTTWGTPMTIFSNNNVGLHPSLKAINGNPAIIFSDFTNKRLIYMRATDTDGTTWGSPTLVASHYGEETKMLVVDGKPAIAYYTGYGDHDLRYLRSNDANGTSWGTHEVLDDGSAAMGNKLSVAIIDGNPAISYQDFTNRDLKYIRSGSVSGLPRVATGTMSQCTSTSAVTIDGSGGVGKWMGLTDGNGDLVAAIENTENLGSVSTEFYIHPDGNRMNDADVNYLGRNVKIQVGNQPTNPIKIRLYFLESEYTALQNATNTSNPNSTNISDLNITKFSSNGCSSVVENAIGTKVLVTNLGQGTVDNGFYIEMEVASFSQFFIHEVGGGPLPVELLSFTGKNEGKANHLNWATASEDNNKGFEIERSLNRRDFENIGFVEGNGNSVREIQYTFTDESLEKGIHYYRLKQIDFDGAYEYSKIIQITVNNEGTVWGEIYPNPSRNQIVNIDYFSEQSTDVSIRILDITGKLVQVQTSAIDEGNQLLKLEFTHLERGAYFIQFQTEGETINRKIIIQ